MTIAHRERVYRVLMVALLHERLPWAERVRRAREIYEACFL